MVEMLRPSLHPVRIAGHLRVPELTAFQVQFHELRRSYVLELAARIAEIELLWMALPTNAAPEIAYTTLHRLAHSLVGSGATFGFRHLSVIARELTLVFIGLIEHATPATKTQQRRIAALLAGLKQAAADIEGDALPTQINVTPTSAHQPTEALRDSAAEPVIVLVEDDTSVAQDLSLQLGHFGYRTQIVSRLDQLSEVIVQVAPAALVVDIVWPEGDLAGIETITAIQRDQERQYPVVFISLRNDMLARLQAVRAGGYAYFPKPIDIVALVDSLDQLTDRRLPEPYRVMIVDDSRLLASIHAKTLELAGMLTMVVTEPLQIFQRLIDFQPDLILLDLYMPEYNGQELASVIRQQPAFVGIPIVFLSAETNRNIQLEVMRKGVDDFLTRSIPPKQLVSVVHSRAQRARLLRDQMMRDGLTGLLNRSALETHLELELARSRRHQTALTVALIDIDHFKTINDSYGHAAGDRVLQSLAYLLQQRLRKSDSIGRYGGEEFGLVMPDTDAATAELVLDKLRSSFAQIRHQFDDVEWHVTFSCGIASVTADASAKPIMVKADAALYTAKRSGRNRVVLFDDTPD